MVRVASGKLNAVDARFFYQELRTLEKYWMDRYWDKINNESLLIVINGKNFFKRRKVLRLAGIETLGDLIEYLDIVPQQMSVNSVMVDDITIKIPGIYVLQILTRDE